MSKGGNIASKRHFEAKVPPCWKRPNENDSLVLKEQWIRAKYERKEFVPDAPEPSYVSGKKKGQLYKRKKDSDKWAQRLFELDEETLRYYVKDKPKEVLPVIDLNITLNSEAGHPNGMQMVAFVKGKTRNYFVYSQSAQEIVEWFCAIRAARLKLLNIKSPQLRREELLLKLSQDFQKFGWVQKTPPPAKASKKNPFQRRWFVLDGKRLLYYASPLAANPLGEILLGSASQGYGVNEECPPEFNGGEYAFELLTPIRSFPLIPEPQNAEEKGSWIKCLKGAIESDEFAVNGGTSYELE
jgi:hypothetical protein